MQLTALGLIEAVVPATCQPESGRRAGQDRPQLFKL